MSESPEAFFQRYVAPDFAELEQQIAARTAALAAAREPTQQVRQAVELGNLLTTARREQEACDILMSAENLARTAGDPEPLGWLLLHLATARQYLGDRPQAQALFAEADQLATAHGLRVLESYVLHHRGRCFAEERRVNEARDCFTRALALRQAQNDPRAASSERALEALAELER